MEIVYLCNKKMCVCWRGAGGVGYVECSYQEMEWKSLQWSSNPELPSKNIPLPPQARSSLVHMQAEGGMLRPGGTRCSQTQSGRWEEWSGFFFVVWGFFHIPEIPQTASQFTLLSKTLVLMLEHCCQQTPFMCKSSSVSHGIPISCNLHFVIVKMEYWKWLQKLSYVEHGVIVLRTKEIFIYRK